MANERPQRRPSDRTSNRGSSRSSDRTSDRTSDRRGDNKRGSDRGGRGRPNDRSASKGQTTDQSKEFTPRPAGPKVPEEITWQDLDPSARRELQSLPKELAERVGAHLAAAGVLIDDEPELAHKHALEARRLASRVAVTREAVGLTAYEAGDYEMALAELRAFRRLSGDDRHLPLVADCERGLGRPERVLELATTPEASRLDRSGQRELTIVVAGARQDLDQAAASVLLLEQDPGLRSTTVDPSLVRLRYAYADALIAAGRTDEGQQWMATVAAQDVEHLTDASDR